MSKILKLHIDINNFPMLFKINNNDLGELCYYIFERGYKSYFPSQDLQEQNINNQFTLLTQNLQNMLGIESHKKGVIGEDMVYNIIKNKFKDHTLEITRHEPHKGDGIIWINDRKIMLEIKNYTKTVDRDELETLLYDMEYNNIDYALFVSLKSS